MKNQHRIGVILFLIPAVVVFLIYFIYPIGFLAYTSLMKWDSITPMEFVGLDNYGRLLEDSVFHKSLLNTLAWGAAAVFIHIPMAMIVAMILSRKIAGWKFFRTVFFIPNLISTLALAMLWQFIYNGEFGLLNELLQFLGLGSWQRNWLGELHTAFPALIGQWIFYIGFFMIIFMSFISTIDPSLYESAQIDGASVLKQEWHITLPLLKPALSIAVLLSLTDTLKNFEAPFLLTNGGPINQTMVLSLHIYNKMVSYQYGYANTLAVMLIAIGAAMVLAVRLAFREKDL
ncbi:MULTISPECIES: carbohydrate ABC transporter permease [unclassified Paenibacillus]|uniref:carbohydrate ABC transporter permease n=1 Tax=unclassified Paenibacillus TaxID=185978 RepID=UPI001C116D3E|nr:MULTISPECIES: sugar ABC transporter permease [unclassified Paenibacillus]MBU5441395.1 sugar ABC transporter permease [Paenibacillus sp. MSJ-34]CAH0118261.1 Diacetylchitobiose uptake system permease protein NgcF [Paenibacillus sp. CECT 9249]